MSSPQGRSRAVAGAEGVTTWVERVVPFWAPQLVVLMAITIDLVLPDRLSPIRPSWLFPALEGTLLIVLVVASPHSRVRHSMLRRRLALGLIGLVSATNMVSLALLVHFLLRKNASVNGHTLILAGAGLWITNVLLFGLWYWELDRGGPRARALEEPEPPDFLFPQMEKGEFAPPGWKPGLVDYLYVSFTNATAFSPTDTMPLTPLAKWLMSAQALASLVTVGLVVARAVNILT